MIDLFRIVNAIAELNAYIYIFFLGTVKNNSESDAPQFLKTAVQLQFQLWKAQFSLL